MTFKVSLTFHAVRAGRSYACVGAVGGGAVAPGAVTAADGRRAVPC